MQYYYISARKLVAIHSVIAFSAMVPFGGEIILKGSIIKFPIFATAFESGTHQRFFNSSLDYGTELQCLSQT